MGIPPPREFGMVVGSQAYSLTLFNTVIHGLAASATIWDNLSSLG